MKKIIVLLIAIFVIAFQIGVANPVNASNAQEDKSAAFQFKNVNMYKEYKELSNKNKDNSDSTKKRNETYISKNIKDIQRLDYLDSDLRLETISENSSTYSKLLYDNQNDTYFYMEANPETGELLFEENNCRYLIHSDNRNIKITSSSGRSENLLDISGLKIENDTFDYKVKQISCSNNTRGKWVYAVQVRLEI